MPKQKSANSERYKKYIREFGNNVLRYNSNVLFCIPCNKEIAWEKIFELKKLIELSFIKLLQKSQYF